jgi:hypothetical protein
VAFSSFSRSYGNFNIISINVKALGLYIHVFNFFNYLLDGDVAFGGAGASTEHSNISTCNKTAAQRRFISGKKFHFKIT